MGVQNKNIDQKAFERKVFEQLDELVGNGQKPLAVAFSGGGDSTALLSLTLKWRSDHPVYALIVDHGLRDGSAQEAKLARSRAIKMGASAQILNCIWGRFIPQTAIQEKARNMRYGLFADACKDIGVNILLLGHNQDDQAETVFMRKDANSGWRGLAGIKPRTRAAIWPALQGVTSVRPLLSCSREDLRLYNKSNNLQWIDDPSNSNLSFARIRARKFLSRSETAKHNLLSVAKAASETLEQEQIELSSFICEGTKINDWGGVFLKPKFCANNAGKIAEALKYLLPAISGEYLSPTYEKRRNLAKRLKAPSFTGATLGGVRLVPQRNGILCMRDLGAIVGRDNVQALPALPLKPNQSCIWDGRFEMSALQSGVHVDVLANWLETLDVQRKALLRSLPEPVRGGLPVFIRDNQIAHIPFVGFSTSAHGCYARALTRERLKSLLGGFYR